MQLLAVYKADEIPVLHIYRGSRGSEVEESASQIVTLKTQDELVNKFKVKVRGRPKGIGCVVGYGISARALGMPYKQAFAIVRNHFKRLRGYTRQSWIEKGFFTGYFVTGLAA
jgi:hypothetical protein